MLALCLDFHPLYTWDNEAAKYMPLQVGNVWVYRGYAQAYIMNGRSYQRYKVVGIIDTLGRKYYKLECRITMISGTVTSGVWQLNMPIRIDSTTMNIYLLQQYCSSTETQADSLCGRLNDSVKICQFQFFWANSTCIDTSSFLIFNESRESKKYAEFFGPGYNTRYVKGIGIVYSSYGYQMNNSYDSLRGCVINGVLYGDTNTIVGINQISSEIPDNFSLSQNYPNPFNPVTNIKFDIPKAGFVKLTVFDAIGKEIQTLLNQQLTAGTYSVDFDGSTLPSGVYYYRIESGAFSETKKMVLIK